MSNLQAGQEVLVAIEIPQDKQALTEDPSRTTATWPLATRRGSATALGCASSSSAGASCRTQGTV